MALSSGHSIRSLRRQSWSDYARDCERRLQVWEGDYVALLQEYVRARVKPEAWDRAYRDLYEWGCIFNVSADVIEQVVRVYNRPAVRELKPEGSDGAPSDAFNLALKGSDIDARMDQALKLAEVCGLSMIRPRIAESLESLDFEVITPDQIHRIQTSSRDGSTITGLEYSGWWTSDGTRPASGRRYVWDMDGEWIGRDVLHKLIPAVPTREQAAEIRAAYAGFVEVDDNSRVVELRVGPDYPYRDFAGQPLLPFVPIRRRFLPGKVCNPAVGLDLYDASLAVGRIWVEWAWVRTHQSHRQIVVTGAQGVAGDQILDPTFPVVIDRAKAGDADEVKVETIDLLTDRSGYGNDLRQIYGQVLNRRGWSWDEFVTSAERQSAQALEIQNDNKQRHLLELQTACRVAEEGLRHAVTAVWNADASPGLLRIPTDRSLTLFVDFANPYRVNPMSAVDPIEKLLKMNLLPATQVVMDINPDIRTEEDALAALVRNREINRKARGLGLGLEALMNTAPPPNGGESEDDDGEESTEEQAPGATGPGGGGGGAAGGADPFR